MSPGIDTPALATPALPSAPEPRDFPRGRESNGEIPGHIDHVPRKGPASLFSGNLLGYPKGRPSTGEIPSDISQVPRKCRSPTAKTRLARSPPPTSRARSPGPPGSTIPGYAGYVPKVGPRNILGLTFKAANESANAADAPSEAPPETDRTGSCATTRTMPEGRVGIPGYAGYIPRKGPTNVFGATYRAGADRAAKGLDPVKEAMTETRRLEESASLWETNKPAGMIVSSTVGAETLD